MQIAHGPLSIVIGLAAGFLLGLICALTPVWSSPLSRAAALLVMGELMAFCGWVSNSHLTNGTHLQLAEVCFDSLIYVAFEYAELQQLSHCMAWHAMICYIVLHCAVLCCPGLCCAVLCHAVLCYAMPCCDVLCHAMPCYAVSPQKHSIVLHHVPVTSCQIVADATSFQYGYMTNFCPSAWLTNLAHMTACCSG